MGRSRSYPGRGTKQTVQKEKKNHNKSEIKRTKIKFEKSKNAFLFFPAGRLRSTNSRSSPTMLSSNIAKLHEISSLLAAASSASHLTSTKPSVPIVSSHSTPRAPSAPSGRPAPPSAPSPSPPSSSASAADKLRALRATRRPRLLERGRESPEKKDDRGNKASKPLPQPSQAKPN